MGEQAVTLWMMPTGECSPVQVEGAISIVDCMMTFNAKYLQIDKDRLKKAATAAGLLQIQWLELSRPIHDFQQITIFIIIIIIIAIHHRRHHRHYPHDSSS
eukprot:8612327-Karenia_brevis.AAC.1